MQKSALTYCFFVFAAIGIGFLFVIFASSLQPSERAKSARSEHDVSSLENGEFLIEDFKGGETDKTLVIKDWNGDLFLYLIPQENGQVPMPDKFWGYWAGYYYCQDFGPEHGSDNKIVPNGSIRCLDENIPRGLQDVHLWTYDGKSLVPWIANMYAPGFARKGSKLYVNR